MEHQGEIAYDDEINLYDYLKVLYKRRVLIIAIFLISVISALIISYRMTPLYKVSAMLSLSFLAEKGSITTNYSVPTANLIASIEGGSYNSQIYEALNLDPSMVSLSFKVSQPKNSTTLQVDYYTPDPAQGKLIVDELLKQVNFVYGERAEFEQEKIDNSIAVAKNQINTIENQKELLKNQRITINNQKKRIASDSETIVNNKKKTISDIESERRRIELLREAEKTIKRQIEEVENNTKLMMEQRSELLKPEGAKMDAGTKILYLNSIQQNIIYLDRLNAQIDKNKMDQEAAKNNIEKLEIKLNDLDVELKKQDFNLKDKDTELMNLETALRDKDNEVKNQIQKKSDLELSKKTVEGNLYIIQPAAASKRPVKPEKKKIIGIAGAASLFLGIFMAFVIEYTRKMQGAIK